MSGFNYFQPTRILFGPGRLGDLADEVKNLGDRCLLVTFPESEPLKPMFERVKTQLEKAGITCTHFDGVIANPTTDIIQAGTDMARRVDARVVIGLGGGSSMDAAKAIAVAASHPGKAWDYLFYKDTQPGPDTLPVVAVSTTSGTGSQVTQVAVLTNPEKRDKSAIYHERIFPRVAIVDPELMLTVPPEVTAPTGFDILCHAFESTLHPGCSPYVELMAWQAIGLVAAHLPRIIDHPDDLPGRTHLAWADTLAGLCIANAGVTLPHGIGMAIGGMYPHVSHGQALAVCYPQFSRFTWEHAIPQFARMGRVLDPDLTGATDEDAAGWSCELLDDFIDSIGLATDLQQLGIPETELADLARQSLVLPDYGSNPRVISPEEMETFLKRSFNRE